MLVHGVFTCFRHFSWDMKLQTSHRKPANPQMKSEQRWQKVGLSTYRETETLARNNGCAETPKHC